MNSPIERTTRSIERMVVTVAQITDMHPGIRLHLTDNGWHCDEATPSVWFGIPFLWGGVHRTIPPWTVTSGYIRLHAANGTWIWRLTDCYRDGTNADGQLQYRLGVWPD
jgi:hypothetical protein